MNQPYDPKRHEQEPMRNPFEHEARNDTLRQEQPMQQNGNGVSHEQEAHQGFAPRGENRRKPWYNGRWLVALAIIAGVFVIGWALSGLTQEVAGVNKSIQAQTGVLQEQNDILTGLEAELKSLTDTVSDGFNRLIDTIRNTASSMTGRG